MQAISKASGRFADYRQQDAHELVIDLLDQLKEELLVPAMVIAGVSPGLGLRVKTAAGDGGAATASAAAAAAAAAADSDSDSAPPPSPASPSPPHQAASSGLRRAQPTVIEVLDSVDPATDGEVAPTDGTVHRNNNHNNDDNDDDNNNDDDDDDDDDAAATQPDDSEVAPMPMLKSGNKAPAPADAFDPDTDVDTVVDDADSEPDSDGARDCDDDTESQLSSAEQWRVTSALPITRCFLVLLKETFTCTSCNFQRSSDVAYNTLSVPMSVSGAPAPARLKLETLLAEAFKDSVRSVLCGALRDAVWAVC